MRFDRLNEEILEGGAQMKRSIYCIVAGTLLASLCRLAGRVPSKASEAAGQRQRHRHVHWSSCIATSASPSGRLARPSRRLTSTLPAAASPASRTAGHCRRLHVGRHPARHSPRWCISGATTVSSTPSASSSAGRSFLFLMAERLRNLSKFTNSPTSRPIASTRIVSALSRPSVR